MIFRIIWILIFLSLGLLFAGANARNMSDISILVYTWKNVPVYAGILSAFAAGVLWSIPLFFWKKKKKASRRSRKEKELPGEFSQEEIGE